MIVMDARSSELRPALNSERKQHLCEPFRHFILRIKDRTLPLHAVLLIVFAVPSVLANVIVTDIVSDFTVPSEDNECFSPRAEPNENVVFTVQLVVQFVSHLFIPLAGWLSDVKIGRRTAIMISLWTGWTGTLLQTLSECFQSHSCSTIELIGKYGLSSLALVFLIPSFTIYYATALAYGMDLLINCSTAKHRSFIYWYAWMFFLSGNSFSITDFLSELEYSNSRLSISFLACVFFTFSLSFNFLITFEQNTVSNPYTKMYDILKSVLCKNKQSAGGYQSALTYWEDSRPSKLDLTKTKYGGLYSHEDVENVKTFFRILLILLVLLPFWISLDPVTNRITSLVPQFGKGSSDIDGLAPFIIFFVGDSIILLAIPLLEFFIIPIFPKAEYFLMSSLKGLGLSQLLLNVAIVLTFVIDITGHLITAEHVNCFAVWVPGDINFNLSYWILLIPSVVGGIADNIAFVCVFEFICSQSPHEMNGMLIGVFWVIRSFSISINSTLSFTLKNWNPIAIDAGLFSCTLWFLIILEVVSLVGLTLYIPVACWYTKRVRTDELTLRTAVEDHFEQQLSREARENTWLMNESEV